jgi:hypothetical protein
MACAFAVVAALATTAGSWIVRANQVGRGLAMIALAAVIWIRRVLGAAVLLGVASVASGVDTGVLARISLASTGKIVFRFHARDLHLVLGPGSSRTPVRFRVRLDGAPPLEDRGVDVDAQGAVEDRTFEIEFLDPGVQAFAFTFGWEGVLVTQTLSHKPRLTRQMKMAAGGRMASAAAEAPRSYRPAAAGSRAGKTALPPSRAARRRVSVSEAANGPLASRRLEGSPSTSARKTPRSERPRRSRGLHPKRGVARTRLFSARMLPQP